MTFQKWWATTRDWLTGPRIAGRRELLDIVHQMCEAAWEEGRNSIMAQPANDPGTAMALTFLRGDRTAFGPMLDYLLENKHLDPITTARIAFLERMFVTMMPPDRHNWRQVPGYGQLTVTERNELESAYVEISAKLGHAVNWPLPEACNHAEHTVRICATCGLELERRQTIDAGD